MLKDLYEALGLGKGATDDEIKKAYRKLAREHHPDMVKDGDKAAAEKRFKEINEAYKILSDPQKRKQYDQFGSVGNDFGGFPGGQGGARESWQQGPFSYTYTSNGSNTGFEGIDPFDIFEEVFGFRGFGGARGPKKGKSLHYELHIEFSDAVKGTEKSINVESGKVNIKIPAGIRDGIEMKFAEKGMPSQGGGAHGDLFLTIRVQTPHGFKIFGDDIGTLVEIDFTQALLGDVIEVLVVDSDSSNGLGNAKLKIPAGTQPNTQFRLKGKGMPKLRGSGRGDVIVEVPIKIPSKITRKQRELMEEYKRAS